METNTPQYMEEHPDFIMPKDVVIPSDWVDASWHNDAMPHWVIDEEYELWINYDGSDCPEYPKFMLNYIVNDVPDCVIHTQDFKEALAILEKHKKFIQYSKWLKEPSIPAQEWKEGYGYYANCLEEFPHWKEHIQ